MTDPRMTIMWLAGAMVDTQFTQSLTNAMIAPRSRGLIYTVMGYQSGPLLARARSEMVSLFLEYDSEWLLMVDSDMVFTPDHIADLYEAADPDTAPIIGATMSGFVPVVGTKTIEAGRIVDGRAEFPDQISNNVEDVDFIGTGMLLMHRGVFERMHDLALSDHDPDDRFFWPWFNYDISAGEPQGEDWTFCARARAIGYPIKVHGGVRIGHCKRVAIYPDVYTNDREEVQ